jgi:hypothetical protein
MANKENEMNRKQFEELVLSFANEYYQSPRSEVIPTSRGPVQREDIANADRIWLMEDFAEFLLTGDRERNPRAR